MAVITDIKGYKSKNKNITEYPKLPSASSHVPWCSEVPVPLMPGSLEDTSTGSSDAGKNNTDFQCISLDPQLFS